MNFKIILDSFCDAIVPLSNNLLNNLSLSINDLFGIDIGVIGEQPSITLFFGSLIIGIIGINIAKILL